MTDTPKSTPALGETVLFKLGTEDADSINRRRQDARDRAGRFRSPDGTQVHVGNDVEKSEVVPAVVTKTFDDGSVNLKALLDGNDDFWAVGRREGNRSGQYSRVAVLEATVEPAAGKDAK